MRTYVRSAQARIVARSDSSLVPEEEAPSAASSRPRPHDVESAPGTTRSAGATLPLVTPEELANLAHLRRARDLMDREYERPLDVAEVAGTALMSPAHFSRQFRAAYGETPHAYLMTRRIERAKELLRRGDMSVTEVCMAVGCTSLGSFSARFTEVVGETPSAFRSRDHSELAGVPGCIVRDLARPNLKRSRIEEALGAGVP